MSGICSEHQGYDEYCPRCNAEKFTQKQIDAQKIKADKAYEKFINAFNKAVSLQTIADDEDATLKVLLV